MNNKNNNKSVVVEPTVHRKGLMEVPPPARTIWCKPTIIIKMQALWMNFQLAYVFL
jgi:hypothetical protein